jgi:hypothetical protein
MAASRKKISMRRLSKMLMDEIRGYHECGHVIGVGFAKQPQHSPEEANWAPRWNCKDEQPVPEIALAIAARYQLEYDLT